MFFDEIRVEKIDTRGEEMDVHDSLVETLFLSLQLRNDILLLSLSVVVIDKVRKCVAQRLLHWVDRFLQELGYPWSESLECFRNIESVDELCHSFKEDAMFPPERVPFDRILKNYKFGE